jgi:hypothetical protein
MNFGLKMQNRSNQKNKSSRLTKKKKKPGVRIQPRDIEVFEWLYKFRFLTAQQIAQLVDPVEQKTALPDYQFKDGQVAMLKRINLLAKEDKRGKSYLKCLKRLFQKYVYTLGSNAVDILAVEKGIFREELENVLAQRKRGDKHLEHALMIAEFGATLAIACKQ